MWFAVLYVFCLAVFTWMIMFECIQVIQINANSYKLKDTRFIRELPFFRLKTSVTYLICFVLYNYILTTRTPLLDDPIYSRWMPIFSKVGVVVWVISLSGMFLMLGKTSNLFSNFKSDKQFRRHQFYHVGLMLGFGFLFLADILLALMRIVYKIGMNAIA